MKTGLVFFIGALLSLPRMAAQSIQDGRVDLITPLLGSVERGRYTIAIGPAPQEGENAVLALMDQVPEGAVIQWQRKKVGEVEFVNLGEVAATLRLSAVIVAMNGDEFRCVVTDGAGATVSSVATLLVGRPILSIVEGNRQTTEAGRFNARPFDLAVWDAAGTQPLVDTPVTFIVESGGGLLAACRTDAAPPMPSLTLKTDVDGTVQAFYRQPDAPNVASKIKAFAGAQEVFFETTSLAPGAQNADGSTGTGGAAAAMVEAGAKGSRLVVGSVAGVRVATSSKQGKSPGGEEPRFSVVQMIAGHQVIVRGSASRYYSVDTGTWTIAAASGP